MADIDVFTTVGTGTERKPWLPWTGINSEEALLAWRNEYLGKNTAITQAFQSLGKLPAEIRPQVGQTANKVKVALEAALAEKSQILKDAALAHSIASETLDVTLPGRPLIQGRLHPDTQMLRELYPRLRRDGLPGVPVTRGGDGRVQLPTAQLPHRAPGARHAGYLFRGSRRARHQPDRDAHAHLPGADPRHARISAPPTPRIPRRCGSILPGMCYRYEQTDARHETQFDQIEGLAVGPGITFSNLKATLSDLARRLFGQQVRTRFRASFFPFTEPSAEFDVECFLCGGKGCAVCGGGWLEIGGCGMVHPNVLRNGGYDPERYTGFAFGLGPQRIAMLRYGINDIRYFWENDMRFLGAVLRAVIREPIFVIRKNVAVHGLLFTFHGLRFFRRTYESTFILVERLR